MEKHTNLRAVIIRKSCVCRMVMRDADRDETFEGDTSHMSRIVKYKHISISRSKPNEDTLFSSSENIYLII